MKQNILALVGAIVVIVVVAFLGTRNTNNNPKTEGSPMPTPSSSAAAVPVTSKNPIAKIITAKGEINIELYPKDAPKTVANFVGLANEGFYNGLKFHRVEAGFVVQGGDPKGNGSGGQTADGKQLMDELDKNTASGKAGYLRGVVAMANSGPNTGESQFFIMLADNNSNMSYSYPIFGKVTTGMDVVDKLAIDDVMTKVTISEK